MYGIKIDLIVPKKYQTYNLAGDETFTVPMFNENFTIEYGYSDSASGQKSASGLEFPSYLLAQNLKLITIYGLEWNGLLETEKNTFLGFIKSFNNSFQPFTMRIWDTASTYTDIYLIIEKDSVDLSKDRFDLWTLQLSLIEVEGV